MRRTAIFDLRGFDIKNDRELNYLFIVQDVRLSIARIHLHESRKDYNLRSCGFARIAFLRAFLCMNICPKTGSLNEGSGAITSSAIIPADKSVINIEIRSKRSMTAAFCLL